ncbi:IS3 family transposase [Kocuria rosea]|uniref:IS3 family transposase n=1 Tax=Kocuria rosea TaxID=1275 RepID=UPI0009E6E608
MGVSKTVYSGHRGRDEGAATSDWSNAGDTQTARSTGAEQCRVYGARRLTAELGHRGHRWNRKKVARLMRVAGVEGIHRRHRSKYGRIHCF